MRILIASAFPADEATGPRVRIVLRGIVLATVAVGFLLPRPASSAQAATAVVEVERAGGSGRLEGAPVAVRFEAFGRRFDLALERHEALVRDGVVAQLAGRHGRRSVPLPAAWIGRGEDGSEARIVVDGHEVDGYVRTGVGTFVIAPVRDGRGRHEVRRAEDLAAEAEPSSCATAVAPEGASAVDAAGTGMLGTAVPTALAASTDAAPRVLDLTIVADAEYARRHGEGAVRDLLALVNTVDDIYRGELGIALQLVQLVVYTDEASQPFSATTDTGRLLSELALARSGQAALQIGAGGVTHLLTGRRMDGGILGMTWLGGACDPRYGAGLSAVDETSSYLAGIVVAHEIGHSLGAAHDGDPNFACGSAATGFVMSPVLRRDVFDQFSGCSRSVIASLVPAATCLEGRIPESCGNGALDPGEDCDASVAGDPGCCRSDCRVAAAGLPCGESGEQCYDALCNGTGECVNVPSNAFCAGDDACVESRCEDGECRSTGIVRGFDELSAKLRLSSEGTVESAKLAGDAPFFGGGDDPASGGVVFSTSLGGAPAWEEQVPADRWISHGRGKFSYRADVATAGRVKTAKIRFDALARRMTFRVSYSRPLVALPPATPEILVLSVNPAGGHCATARLSDCSRRGGSYRCT